MMLAGKVAIVSGVGPGVGQELASIFAREGAAVVLAARNEKVLADTAAQIERNGGKALAVPTDITQVADCARVAKQAQDRFGAINVLVNNAFQMGPWSDLMESDLNDSWDIAFDVNVKGSLRMTQAALPALKASKGSIVMVNTVAMRSYRPQVGCYAISKGGLQTATRYLASELAGFGVRVNAVVPGYIDGPPLQSSFIASAAEAGVSPEDIRRQVTQSLPLRRIPTSADVAEAILFFASSRSQAITGASLDINAGEFSPL